MHIAEIHNKEQRKRLSEGLVPYMTNPEKERISFYGKEDWWCWRFRESTRLIFNEILDRIKITEDLREKLLSSSEKEWAEEQLKKNQLTDLCLIHLDELGYNFA